MQETDNQQDFITNSLTLVGWQRLENHVDAPFVCLSDFLTHSVGAQSIEVQIPSITISVSLGKGAYQQVAVCVTEFGSKVHNQCGSLPWGKGYCSESNMHKSACIGVRAAFGWHGVLHTSAPSQSATSLSMVSLTERPVAMN